MTETNGLLRDILEALAKPERQRVVDAAEPPSDTFDDFWDEVMKEPLPDFMCDPAWLKCAMENGLLPPVADATVNATDAQQGESVEVKKVRQRVVDAAKRPGDYVLEYLDTFPDALAKLAVSDYGYRELADDIGRYFGHDFDHSTVFRAVKKWRKSKSQE